MPRLLTPLILLALTTGLLNLARTAPVFALGALLLGAALGLWVRTWAGTHPHRRALILLAHAAVTAAGLVLATTAAQVAWVVACVTVLLLPGTWPGARRRAHQLAQAARRTLARPVMPA
ncbi:hypothetical protein [Deinococcus sp. PEB2-63]